MREGRRVQRWIRRRRRDDSAERMPATRLGDARLTIRFGGHVAVDRRDAAPSMPGTLTAIVGPNGAGKTTYFNLISGQLPASAGTRAARRRGHHRLGAARRAPRCGIGRAFQLTNLFPNLTVLENVRLAVQARARRRRQHRSRVWNSRARLDRARRPLSSRPPTSPTSATRRPWPCRTATSASSRWRS